MALKRLVEQLPPRGVRLNEEKTKIVDVCTGGTFGYLGFDIRRVPKRKGTGCVILMTLKKKSRRATKAKIREIISNSGSAPVNEIVSKINAAVAGWVNYFRVGNTGRIFSEIRDYLEMKVRTLLTRQKRRRKSSVGWRRWSNEYLYGVLGLYWNWKIRPLGNVEVYK